MKKLLLLICVTVMGTGISAQTDTRDRQDTHDQQETRERQEKLDQHYDDQSDSEQDDLQDGYIYKNGRMMTVNNGMTSVMKKETTLENGTVLAINGNYTTRDGEPTMLKPGEHMDSNGMITNYGTPKSEKVD